MKADAVKDLERLYDQSLEFLKNEGLTSYPAPGPSRIDYQNNFRTIPEKYLLKDNLLLLLKES